MKKATTDIQKKSDKDLAKGLADKRKESRDFRFGVAGSKVRNMNEGAIIRKDIARILTEVNRRKREQN